MLRPARILACMTLILALTSCGLQQYVKHTNVAGYPFRYADFDYKYAWKTVTTDQGVEIDGVMKNVRYPYVEGVQVTVFVVEKGGRIITRATTFPTPQQAREDDVSQFILRLRNVKPEADDVFHFLIRYSGNEWGAVDWISSFKVDALTGAVIRPPAGNPDDW